jgi:hypothetical protein
MITNKTTRLLMCALVPLMSACGVKHDLEMPAGTAPAAAVPTGFKNVDPSRPPHPLGEDTGTAPSNVSH